MPAGSFGTRIAKAAARGPDDGSRRVKKAAAPKPAALKGQTAKVRRAEAQKAGAVVEATDELPKSFLVAAEYGQTRVYLTKYNAAILQRRLQEPQRSPIPGKGEKL